MRPSFAAIGLVLLAGCGDGERVQRGLETFEISGGPQRYLVDILDEGNGQRQIIVSSAGYRGLDRGEGTRALSVARQAAEKAQCNTGQGVRVLPDTAIFYEKDQGFSALGRGSNSWQFKGLCGG
ncbi:MAG: hypothetical protein AAF501_09370 [Pseudomonadota bacterium]